MSEIAKIIAREILDSRGNPTIEVDVILKDGSLGRASVPSGASTGKREALELRDHDKKRYNGLGVLNAISKIHNIIAPALIKSDSLDQLKLDETLINLDGSADKSNIGANAILAVSLANAKAASISKKLPLYRYLGGDSFTLPIPMMNILNGGMHADNKIDLQEFMIMPINAASFSEALRMGAEVFYALKSILKTAKHNVNVGDEGGFAPQLGSSNQALEYIIQAIIKAGFIAGKDIGIALDAAANEFYERGLYNLKGENKQFDNQGLINYYKNLVNNYPILSIEDPLAENDIEGWQLITKELGRDIQVVGDDVFVTNSTLLEEGIKNNIANAILIKPNQIGTLTETLTTMIVAKRANYNTIISHRSGDTEDTMIAHLAVATNAGQIKTGSLSRSERICKYNELLRIEEELGDAAKFAGNRS